MHKAPIFNDNSSIESGYVIVYSNHRFYITGETKPKEADEHALTGDLYRINVKLKENTNA